MKRTPRSCHTILLLALALLGAACDGDATQGEAPDAGASTTLDTGITAPDVSPHAGACDPAQCDDGNPCTKDECAAGACVSTPLVGATCDDGNACTKASTCSVEGQCVGAESVSCDDGNACTADTCDTSEGCVFEPLAEGSPCEDGTPCTVGDTCQAGECAGTPKQCEEDDNECTVLVGCSPTTGDCEYKTVTNGAPCEDGDLCTINEACKSGICEPGGPKGCEDNNPCTQDSCDPKNGCVYVPVPVANMLCDDKNKCTTNDVCAFAKCSGTPIACDDGNPCTEDTCDIAKGCAYAAIGAPCDDGDACTKNDICQDGECGGKPVACPEAGPCQVAACDAESGKCVSTPKAGQCDDGDPCTTADACGAEGCQGAPVSCDDGDPCTDDACAAGAGCTHTDNAAPCDDGDECTTGDVCDAGACKGAGTCGCQNDAECEDDGDLCNGTKQCVSEKCVHKPGSEVVCDPSEAGPCQTIACDSATGQCKTSPAPDGEPCDDATACTTPDTCESGACGGTEKDCDDGNPCTTDTCDAATGCKNEPNDAPCDDDDACTVGDQCSAGTCEPGVAANCNDGNDCTDDTCTPESGCEQANNVKACEDGDACTEGDACNGGACKAGAEAVCNDDNPCTDDTCHETLGCQHTNNVTPCDDEDACTENDTCKDGACQAGESITCEDGNPCTDDTCNPESGCEQANNVASCEDGDACTEGDICSRGACEAGAPAECNDGNLCTDDTCHPTEGCQTANNEVECDDGDACTENDTCGDGTCQPGTSVTCEDGNSCTDDPCDLVAGCTYTYNLAPCSDESACTVGDVCLDGQCVGGEDLACNDNNICTDDTCVAATGCTYTANAAPCDDGDVCTVGDTCAGGECAAGGPLACDDGNPCTTDACDVASGCTAEPNALPCDDGDPCTTDDTCDGSGGCAGAVPSGAWIAAAMAPTPRLNHTATLLADGRVLVAGGADGATPVGTADLFDPYTNSWSPVGAMKAARDLHLTARLDDGRVLVVGGRQGGTPIGDAELYDPKTKTWTATAGIPGRYHHGMVRLDDGKVLVFGGYPSYSDARLYDPTLGTWSQAQSMLSGRYTHGFTRLADGRVLVFGGEDSSGNTLATAEIYNPATGKWLWTGTDMQSPRKGTGTSGVLLPDGRVLVTNGFDGTTAVAFSEIYDPSIDQWSAGPENVFARVVPAVLLPEGFVLLAGGVYWQESFNYTATSEVFSLTLGTWGAVAPLPTMRSGHTVTVLADGRALVMGGTTTPGGASGTKDALLFELGCALDAAPRSCSHIAAADPGALSGIYTIDPDKSSPGAPFDVYCEMELDGGGWTLVAVSSDDGQDTWTWNNRHYWDTDNTAFGSVEELNMDYKSSALHSMPFSDIAFIHAPSGAWASYHDTADGHTSLSQLIGQIGEKCWTPGTGWPLTTGDLGGATGLCDTQLYFNAKDYDGMQTCSTTTATQNTYGPVWSAISNDSCPFDDPAGRSLGPISNSPDSELYITTGDVGLLGFGFSSKEMNTGTQGSATNYMWVLVRSAPAFCDGKPNGIPCDDSNPNTTTDACVGGVCTGGMIEVPAGDFWMGCAATDTDCQPDEKPRHPVMLKAYQIDQTEVTVSAFRACTDSGACSPPVSPPGLVETDCNWYVPNRDRHPVNCLAWNDADAYCSWAGKRLCTEAEWEKAARGGCDLHPEQECQSDARIFPWGSEPATCDYASYYTDSWACGTGITSPVATHPEGASAYGVQDMAGNVWEWVSDWYSPTYYTPNSAVDPTGPETGTSRVFRGGGIGHGPAYLRSSMRNYNFPETLHWTVAIRCCADPDWGTPLPDAACAGQPDGTPCDDGDPTTTGDSCSGGQCIAGAASGDAQCTGQADGALCEDDAACTDNDHCSAGSCIGDPIEGCTYASDDLLISDDVVLVPEVADGFLTADCGVGSVSTTSGLQLQSGDILIGQVNGGFLCRVTDVAQSGTTLFVSTERAYIDDVIVQGSVEFVAAVAFADESVQPLKAPADVPFSAAAEGEPISASLTIPTKTLYSDGATTITLNPGQLTFEPLVHVKLGLGYFRAQLGGQLSASFGLKVASSVQKQWQTSKTPILSKAVPFTFVVAGIPLSGYVDLTATPWAWASVQADFDASLGYTWSRWAMAGMEYSDGSWKGLQETGGAGGQVTTSFSAAVSGSAKLTLDLKADLRLYGIHAAYLMVSPRLEGQASADETLSYDYSVQGCLWAGVGGEYKVWKIDLPDWSKGLFDKCWNLYSGSGCFDECSSGGGACLTSSSLWTCAEEDDGDTCLDVVLSTCPTGATCSNGSCGSTCTSACSAGQVGCEGGTPWTCGDPNGDGCLNKMLGASCQAGTSCSGGSCVSSCTDECGYANQKGCDGSTPWTCGQYDGDSCLDKSAGAACQSGWTCSGGTCVSTCTDDCVQGEKSCSGNTPWTCAKTDADPCWDISYGTSCGGGTECDPGTGTCVDPCEPQAYTGCANGDVYYYDSCGNLTDVKEYCADGCSSGACLKSCPSSCSSNGNCNPTTGVCTCYIGYTGSSCNACSSGYENYPNCVPKDPNCPSGFTYGGTCSVVLEFNETLPFLPVPETFGTYPTATVVSVALSYFTAKAQLGYGKLTIDKTLIGSTPGGYDGVNVWWGGLTKGKKYVKFGCQVGDHFTCTGGSPMSCQGLASPQVLVSTSTDANFSCGMGKKTGLTEIHWVVATAP